MRYSFADYEMQWKANCVPINTDELSSPFSSASSAAPELLYEESLMPKDFFCGAKRLKYTSDYELYDTDRGLFLLNHWTTCREAFGFWLKDLRGKTSVYFHPDMAQAQPMAMSYFLSTIGLHHKLLRREVSTVHASYIEFAHKAILFLGPSGTGKSTQAQLWSDYAGARIINGDRALLRKKDGVWTAYGCPFCGSSSICVNKDLPLAAIIVLKQAAQNRVEELTAARRIMALTCATELYPWDKWEIDQAFRLSQEIVSEVPMLQLSCTPEENAVNVLRKHLENVL